jgi:hypothetical protein
MPGKEPRMLQDQAGDGSARPFWQQVLDARFVPKRFESTALYERSGALFIKRYAPTGGDFFIRRYGVRIADIRGNLDSLGKFERQTRRLEAIHELVFLGFLAWSAWRAVTGRTTNLDLVFAMAVYVVLILFPAMLQRYDRLRVNAVIRHMRAQQMRAQ